MYIFLLGIREKDNALVGIPLRGVSIRIMNTKSRLAACYAAAYTIESQVSPWRSAKETDGFGSRATRTGKDDSATGERVGAGFGFRRSLCRSKGPAS